MSSVHSRQVVLGSRLDVEREHRFEVRDPERFDRLQFAMRVLALLRPDMAVTLYEGRRRLQVTRGRDWSVGRPANWAMVAIPKDASRHHITFALAEMAGVSETAFVASLLARAAATPFSSS
ncbi:MAG TPA: hypothetical protein VFQ61_36510 [Polyangiaceae bacterium]|nr:hypothetical protein [Polyangiaceae bacterium]